MTSAPGHGRQDAAAGATGSGRRLDVALLRQDRRLWVWWHRGQSRRLVVVFSSVGYGPETPPIIEFVRSATADGQDNAMFVADPARSWLNAPNLIEEIVEAVDAARMEVGAEEIVTMGFSMGGFMALAISGFTPVSATLAFSPQISIDPEIAPEERRWKPYRKRIPAIRIRSAVDHMSPDTQHTIIMGDALREAPQTRLLPVSANVDAFILPDTRHDTPARIKEAGILPDVLSHAFARRRGELAALLSNRFNARSHGVTA